MQFKQTQLTKILGISSAVEAQWIQAINDACAKYGIDTKLRLAAWIAQIGHESGRLKYTEENLNYSAQGLTTVFGKYFDSSSAQSYARKPEKIANRVYANRMGNGSEASGDGWKYRGRGLIQCTGKSTYGDCSRGIGTDALSNPDVLSQPQYAALSAAWFWNSRNLNDYADRKDFLSITKRINGGTNGQADRQALYERALIVLSDEDPDDGKPKPEVPPDSTDDVSSKKSPTAVNSKVSEPRATAKGTSLYPWNAVFESRSGHITQIDDTPGNEKISMSHRTGSYWEIDPLGTYTLKTVLDSYYLTKGDSYGFTGGNHTYQIKGQSFTSTDGNWILKAGSGAFIETPRLQVNGQLAVSGEVTAPSMSAGVFTSPYADTLAKVAMVAWDIGGGTGGSAPPVINGSIGFSGSSVTDSMRTNTLDKTSADGRTIITNGIDPAAPTTPSTGGSGTSGSSGSTGSTTSGDQSSGSTATTADGTQDASTQPSPNTPSGNGFASALAATAIAGAIGLTREAESAIKDAASSQDSAATDQTMVMLKHTSFDKPTLLSQSLMSQAPDPRLFVNNYHTIVDPLTGKGNLYVSDGTQWVAVAGQVQVPDTINTLIDDKVQAEATARATAIAQEASDRTAAIVAEAQARNDAITNESAARGAALNLEATNRTAAIEQEAASRLKADADLGDDIVYQYNQNAISIAAARVSYTARQTSDGSLSQRIEVLSATVDGNTASIVNEAAARADADTALTNTLSALTARVGTAEANLTTEQTARADADFSLSQQITTLNSTLGTTSAQLTSEITARTDADTALGTRIDSTEAANASNLAAINSEITTRATADTALSTKIDNLTATNGAVTVLINSEATARVDADGALGTRIDDLTSTNGAVTALINTEASTRATADTALGTRIDTVSASTAANTAAISTETQARTDADTSLASNISVVQAGLSANMSFKNQQLWQFDASLESWSGSGSTVTLDAVNSVMREVTSGSSYIYVNLTDQFNGGNYTRIRARVRRTAGTAAWVGAAYYSTGSHGYSTSYYKTVSAPADPTKWTIIEWDMSSLTAGGTDWTTNTVTAIRLDLVNDAGDTWEYDWISIGEPVESAGTYDFNAFVVSEQQARISGDSANASAITTLSTTVNGNTASITTQQASIDGISANYGVKVDNNGYVSGFGLLSTSVTGTPISSFNIISDKFALVKPTLNGGTPVIPFSVDTTTTPTTITFDGLVRMKNGNYTPGSVTSDKLDIGGGVNFLQNSGPSRRTAAYYYIGNNNTGQTPTAALIGGDPYRPAGGSSVYFQFAGTPANGTVCDIYNDNYGPGSAVNHYNVVAGKNYEFSVYLSAYRCGGGVGVVWLNSSGAYVGQNFGTIVTNNAATGELSNWFRSTLMATCPAGATQCYVVARMYCNGTANPYLFTSEWYAGPTLPNQTTYSDWRPAGVTTISGGMIETDSISAINANLGSITAGDVNLTNSNGANNMIRTNGKWWGDGANGFVLARQTDGTTFVDIQASNSRFRMSSWGDCAITFPNFSIDNSGNLYCRGDIQATSLTAGTVNTNNIVGNAVTNLLSASGSYDVSIGITCTGGPVAIMSYSTAANPNTAQLIVRRDGNYISMPIPLFGSQTVSFMMVDYPAAGFHTYRFTGDTSGTTIGIVMETKR